ncbi:MULTISPECIES: MFS transporter [Paenibacillus]|uniref:MFS transporter n=1 Tax=Paenibacillus TaxID=44249 RepID=UPI00058A2A71|nr:MULTISPECIES: MFS transporter [Paenibacillus]AJE53352.1 MFS transporter [Paenibacillus polymyxa]KAF6568485.1 MFS transporter [Paenibacillus sp. EKM202P]KAF6570330.1 MFS transporter [Paenibacillus sp. EKM207P]QOH62802.1 MFS transporter [Paenibacillus polymyxa]
MKQIRRKKASQRLWTPFFAKLWILVFLVEFMKGSLLVSILPVYMGETLGLSAGIIGLAFSLQYFGDNAFRAPAGWMAERLGYRGTMSTALLFTLVAIIMLSTLTEPVWLVIACLLLGLGTSPLWPCVMTGTTEMSGPNNNNGAAMGTLEIASMGGTGFGPLIMNFAISHYGHSYGMVFMILIGCSIVLLLVALMLPGTNRSAGKDDLEQSALISSGGNSKQKRQVLRGIQETINTLKTKLNVNPLIYPALFLQSFVIGLISPVLTLYARTDLGISPNLYSVLLIAGGGVTVLALIPCGKLVDRLGTKYFLHIGFLLAGTTLFFFSTVQTIPLVFVSVAIIGLGYALILPAWNTFLAQLIPESERATVWGFFLTLQGSGMVIGPLVSGVLWDRAGHTAPFIISGIVMLLMFGCHLALARNPRRKTVVKT